MTNLGRNMRIVFVALALAWLFAHNDAAAQTRIRLATLLPQGSSQYHVLEQMGQQWRTSTSGAVNLTIYAGGTMGSEEDTVRRMRIGQLQAATISVDGLSEIDPSVGALQKIPMLYHSLEELEYARAKMQPEMERRLAAKGFVVLFWADGGWAYIFSRQPALRPEEFKKTKVFVTAGDKDEIAVVQGLGFPVVPLEWTDVLVSLQTGLVDTVPTTPFLALAGQYDLAAKNVLQLNYIPLVGATVIMKKTWDSFTLEQREQMQKAALEAGKEMQAQSRAEGVQAVEAMKKRGLQVHAVSPELESEWRHFVEAAYPKIRGTIVPADVFDELQHVLAEYRSAQKSGHS